MKKVHDPYRDEEVTLYRFAVSEGAVPSAAYSYYKWHGSLEGFRDRLANRYAPRTYTLDGKFVTAEEAARLVGASKTTLQKMHKRGITDVGEMAREVHALKALYYGRAKRYETDDRRFVTIRQAADETGSTRDMVVSWIRRFGSLKGFTARRRSRSRPVVLMHSEMGVSKTVREWAAFYSGSRYMVQAYAKKTGGDMKGFEDRNRRRGNSRMLRQFVKWAKRLRKVNPYYVDTPEALVSYIKGPNWDDPDVEYAHYKDAIGAYGEELLREFEAMRSLPNGDAVARYREVAGMAGVELGGGK